MKHLDKCKKYELMLPYTIEVLAILKEKTYVDFLEIDNKNTIVLKNSYHEWIGFSGCVEGIKEALIKIKLKDKVSRIIFFHQINKDNLTDLMNEIPFVKKYYFEDFMICHYFEEKNNVKLSKASSIKDIHCISELNMKYRKKEISWKYYHKNLDEIVEEYLFQNKFLNVVGIGNPFKAMGEFIGSYKSYKMLGRIYVDEIYQGRGLGKQLIEGMTRECLDNDFIPVLTVREDNAIAQHIYRTCNYTKEGNVLYCYI